MRALIVGGGVAAGPGSRGLALARILTADGHAVRVAVAEDRRDAVAAAGCEPWVGTPDRIGTLRYALENVTILLWLLGDEPRPELHGSRLQMMLERTIDTTARGVVYEASGPYAAQGSEIVRRMATRNEIPFELIAADPLQLDTWLAETSDAVGRIIAVDRAELPAAWDA